MRTRSWAWLRTRIFGLLTEQSRLRRHFDLQHQQQQGPDTRGAESSL